MRLPACLALGTILVAACATGNEEPENANEPSLSGTTPVGLDQDGDGVVTPVDCDDKDPAVKPGAAEVCNGKDDNCDGRIDEGFDADGDGYVACPTPTKAADCNDANPAVHPGAAEVCNNVDDNCDGTTDEGFDKDGDLSYECARGETPADCDDNSKTSHPGATEVCDGKDNDCDGKIDDIPANLAGSLVSPGDPHWRMTGSAAFWTTAPNPGWVRLTETVGGTAGGLWWVPNDLTSAGYLFDSFEVTARFHIDAIGADGIGFAWYPGTTPLQGYPGDSYGINGTGGYGVVIDTYPNGVEPAPSLVIYKSAPVGMAVAGTKLYQAAIGEVRGNAADGHTIRVKLAAGAVSVRIDSTDVLNNYAIAGYVPFQGIWGFAAATGGIANGHSVRDVVMKFPDGQGCLQ